MRRGGLGKGLGALIPTDAAVDRDAIFRSIPVSCIRPNPYQPRSNLDEEALAGLAASIGTLGVLQPVLVRPVGDDQFELIAGERRWRGAKRAGLQLIPALVQVANDVSTLEQALVENLHREDLNSLEEAAAYQQLIEDFAMTHEDLARRVGKSRTTVTNTLRLLQLPPAVQRLVAERALSPGHARALLGTPDRAFQESLARRAVAESLSVRAVEDAVRMRNEGPAAVPGKRAKARPNPLRPAPVLELEELLAARLDTRVRVDLGTGKGRVVIEFATIEDLERIYRAMIEGPPGSPAHLAPTQGRRDPGSLPAVPGHA